MAGLKTALLLEAFARVGREGTGMLAQRQMAGQPKRKNAGTSGCSPCEAMAKVQAARQLVGTRAPKGKRR